MKMRTFFLLLAVLALLLVVAQPAAAAPLMGTTITVTTTADDFTANGNCTLREAIQAANTDTKVDRCPAGSGTDVIKLGALTYRLTRAGRLDNANRTGDFDLRSSMVIAGAGIGKTVIDGGELDRIFDGRSTTITVTIQDMTIQDGFTDRYNVVNPDHGGAVVNRGTMTIRRVRFEGNHTGGEVNEQGGAVWNKGKLTITTSRFHRNTSDSYGGAVGNIASLAVDATVFEENYAPTGGAIYNAFTGTMALNANTKFYRNQSAEGEGAVINNQGTMTAKYNRFEGNGNPDRPTWVINNVGSATIRYTIFDSNGGGPLLNTGKLILSHSHLSSNDGNYGAQIASREGTVVVDKTTITHGTGTGVALISGTGRVANSTFYNIYGDNAPSGIENGGGDLSIDSVTIWYVGTNGGAGLKAEFGVTRLHNSIITGTVDYEYENRMLDCRGTNLISLGHNLISSPGECAAAKTSGDLFGASYFVGLNGPDRNGGPTPTCSLAKNSAARDAGDPAKYFKTDQRGYLRPAGTRPDIGAYEYGAAAP